MNGVITLDPSDGWEPPAPGRRSYRWVAVVLVLAAVFAVVTGPRRLTPLTPATVLPGAGISDFDGDGDDLYVVRHLDPVRSVVESYRMPSGVKRWTSPVDAQARFVGVDGGRVVVTTSRPDRDSVSALMALDAASGAPVWRRDGYEPSLYGSAGGAGVIVAEPSTVEGPDRSLSGIDTRTGDVRWTLAPPTDSTREYVRAGDDITSRRVEIAELDPNGALRIRSPETAETVRSLTIDNPGRVDGFGIAGDRLLAYRMSPPDAPDPYTMVDAAVFDLATGRRLWHRTGPGQPPLWWCGRALCAGTDGAIAAHDPVTGRVLWRLDGWTNLDPVGGNRLLATRITQTGERLPNGIVVDAATGRTLRRIDGWTVIGVRSLPHVLLANRNWVARFDLDTNKLTTIGRTASLPTLPQCVTTATALACLHGQLSIWRLSPDG